MNKYIIFPYLSHWFLCEIHILLISGPSHVNPPKHIPITHPFDFERLKIIVEKGNTWVRRTQEWFWYDKVMNATFPRTREARSGSEGVELLTFDEVTPFPVAGEPPLVDDVVVVVVWPAPALLARTPLLNFVAPPFILPPLVILPLTLVLLLVDVVILPLLILLLCKRLSDFLMIFLVFSLLFLASLTLLVPVTLLLMGLAPLSIMMPLVELAFFLILGTLFLVTILVNFLLFWITLIPLSKFLVPSSLKSLSISLLIMRRRLNSMLFFNCCWWWWGEICPLN